MTTRGPRFERLGGHPVLDFNNTVAWERSGLVNDRLPTFDALLAWGRWRGVVSAGDAQRLAQGVREQPARAMEALWRARAARAVLHDLWGAAARGRSPAPETLSAFESLLRAAGAGVRVTWGKRAVTVTPHAEPGLDLITDRVVWMAARLLESGDLALLRQCADPNCGWLFLDRTKNGSRRWCSMSDCGSRAKARRYYRRRRGKKAGGARRPRGTS